MNEIDEYLGRVMKGTFLRSDEKAQWLEEMRSHLEDAVENYKSAGLSDAQARQRALRSFGEIKGLRHQIVRETFVISPRWYVLGAILCLLAAIAALFTNMRFDDAIVTTGNAAVWKHLPNPSFVVWLHRYLPLNSERWVVLGVMSLMMVFTRRRTDRVAVLVSWIPFGLQILPWAWSMHFSRLVVSPYSQGPGIALVAALVLSLFLWTGNPEVSLAPWVMSVADSSVTFGWHLLQSTLSQWTGNPIFWGLSQITWVDALSTISSIALQVLLAFVFVRVIRKRDSHRNNRMKAV